LTYKGDAICCTRACGKEGLLQEMAVLWTRVKALGLPVVEAVARGCEGIACFLETLTEQVISTCNQDATHFMSHLKCTCNCREMPNTATCIQCTNYTSFAKDSMIAL